MENELENKVSEAFLLAVKERCYPRAIYFMERNRDALLKLSKERPADVRCASVKHLTKYILERQN